MSKLVVSLKQHTSLIHFKPNEENATIRITELKPKLDKFLLKKEKELSEFLLKESDALNYKIKFINIEKNQQNNNSNKIALYFGNMGNSSVDKKRIFNDRITLEFFSFSDKIIEKISRNIAEFFMNVNFATRQSKGFGSFTVDKIDGKEIIADESLYPSKYYFDINKHEDKVFEEIEKFYKSLRSGIVCKNDQGVSFTIDPMIKLYFESKGIIWDKKTIKDKIERKNNLNDKYLVKDLLGLSSSESWRFSNCRINKKSIGDENIDRFKSPITFKIIKIKKGYRVFLILDEIDSRFLNNEFSILKDNREILQLITPSEFDLEEFIEYSINNIEEYLEVNNVGKCNRRLLSIYEDIREGL